MRTPTLLSIVVALCSWASLAELSFAQATQRNREPILPADEAPLDDQPGYLGIVADDRLDMGHGIRVVEALEESPAAQGGLAAGDVIGRIDGHEVKTLADMAALLQHAKADQQVRFEVQREGQLVEVTVTLGRRPPPEKRRFQNFGPIAAPEGAEAPGGGPPRRRLLGLTTVALEPGIRAALAVPVEQGAVVTRIESRSPAAEARIPIDAVIVSVNGDPVTGPADLARHVATAGAGKSLELDYFVRGQRQTARVTLKDYLAGPAGVPGQEGPFGFSGGPTTHGGPVMPEDQRVIQLEARIADLEARIEQLERNLKSAKN